MKTKILLLLFLAPLVALGALHFFGAMHEARGVIFFLNLFWVVPFLLVVSGFLLRGFAIKKGQFVNSWRFVTAVLLAVGLGSYFFSEPLGRSYHQASVAAAKAHLEQIIPALEAFKRNHGRYPESLTMLGLTDFGDHPPHLVFSGQLRNCNHLMLLDSSPAMMSGVDNNYVSDGESYTLCFHGNDAFDTMGSMYFYSSEDGFWDVQYR